MNVGSAVGRYRLERALGSGAHGDVWLAQSDDGVRVALKMLRADVAEDPDLLSRFRREARLAQTITDPHVVRCLDAGEHQGRLFLTAELVTGGDLDGLLQRYGGRLPRPVALAAAADILRGLCAIHAAGLIHRDIKPANVMLDASGRAKVADLGLARPTATARTRYTADGMIVGSPAYLAPESIRAEEELDIRVDLYAVGVVLWQTLVGALPFQGATVFEILRHHLETPPPRLDAVMPGVPPALADLVQALLAKSAADRPATPQAALDRLLPLAEADGAATMTMALAAMPGSAGANDPATYPVTLADGAAVYPVTLADGAVVYPVTLADGGVAFPATLADGAAAGAQAYPRTLPDGAVPAYPRTLADGAVPAYPRTLADGAVPAYPRTLADGAIHPATVPDRERSLAQGGFTVRGTPGSEPTLDAAPTIQAATIRVDAPAPRPAHCLELPGGIRVFVYGGTRLQCGRDAREHGSGNDVCLRLFPAQAMAERSRRLSGRHCVFTVSPAGAVLEDLASAHGTTLDGVRVPPKTAQPVGDGAVVRLADELALRAKLIATTQRHQVEGLGLSGAAMNLELRRVGNGEQHVYLLIGGALRLGVDPAGSLHVGSGPLELVALGDGLWRRDGDELVPLCAGDRLTLTDITCVVSTIDPALQKG